MNDVHVKVAASRSRDSHSWLVERAYELHKQRETMFIATSTESGSLSKLLILARQDPFNDHSTNLATIRKGQHSARITSATKPNTSQEQ